MRGVTLLPEELGSSEERPGPELPPEDVGPLIDLEGEVAVRGDPGAEGIPYYRL